MGIALGVLVVRPGGPNVPVKPLPFRVSTSLQGVIATKVNGSVAPAAAFTAAATGLPAARILACVLTPAPSTLSTEVASHRSGECQLLIGICSDFSAGS